MHLIVYSLMCPPSIPQPVDHHLFVSMVCELICDIRIYPGCLLREEKNYICVMSGPVANKTFTLHVSGTPSRPPWAHKYLEHFQFSKMVLYRNISFYIILDGTLSVYRTPHLHTYCLYVSEFTIILTTNCCKTTLLGEICVVFLMKLEIH